MNLLLDTHTFLWFCQANSSLSESAKSLLENSGTRKLVSVASCWEIAIKTGLKKLTLGEPVSTYLANALAVTGFELLPISLAHAAAVESLPLHHRDPFDRLLVAQAMAERLHLVSNDPVLDAYSISRLW